MIRLLSRGTWSFCRSPNSAHAEGAPRLHHEGALFSPACGRGKFAWRHAEKSRCLRSARTLYTRNCGVCVRSALGGCPRSGQKKQIAPLFLRRPCRSCFLKSCFAKYQIFRKRGGVFFVRQSSCQCNAKGMAVPGARDVMTFPSTTTSSVSGAAPISLSSMPG